MAPTLQEQRDLLCGGLADLGFDVIVPQATYFATVEFTGRARLLPAPATASPSGRDPE